MRMKASGTIGSDYARFCHRVGMTTPSTAPILQLPQSHNATLLTQHQQPHQLNQQEQ